MGIFFPKLYKVSALNLQDYYNSLPANFRYNSVWNQIPHSYNYTFETFTSRQECKVLGRMLRINEKYYSSDIPLSIHVEIINFTPQCKIMLSEDQYLHIKKLNIL